MCMEPERYGGPERRESTPVDVKHLGWGPRIALVALIVTLVVNVLITGMAYQRLVSNDESQSRQLQQHRNQMGLMVESVTELTASVASLTSAVESLASRTARLERQVDDNH